MSIHSIPFYQSCHRAGEARGDSLGTSKRTATPDRIPSRHDGLPRPSLGSLLAMTKGEVSFYRMAGFRACTIVTSFVLI